ncbi:cytochrome c biogenesis protein CcsA [Halorutilales archaeon Cl-col2-1]
METGNILIIASAVAGLVATLLLVYDYVRDTDRFTRAVSALIPVASLGLVSSLVYLTYQFVVGDYTNAYVFENSADYLPLLYKITGVYASNQGSVLLWGAIASVVAVWALITRGLQGKHNKLVQAISVGIVTYFAGMLLTESPFSPISEEFPDAPQGFVPPDGNGLNPLLIDPFMAIHPPLMFIAYSLLIVPFGIGTTHFISKLRGEEGIFDDWMGSVMRWLRVSWLFLTVAIALGGVWSYRVLGWGGFWAWDPVETAILVPWLFLTASVHSVTNYRGGTEYSILAPASIAVGFPLTVYTTSVVRSDVFRSVHSFASGGIGTSILILLGISTFLGVVLPAGYWFMKDGEPNGGGETGWITRSNLLHAGVLLLGLLTFVSFWGLSFPLIRNTATGVEVSVENNYYNLWSYPLVVATVLLSGFYMDYDVEGKKKSLMGLGLFSVATVAAAFISPSAEWHLAETAASDQIAYRVIGSVSVLSAVPPAVYLSMSVVKRLYSRVSTSAGRNRKLKETGITVIHVGVAVLLVSISFTYLFTVQSSVIVDDVNNVGDEGEMYNVPDSDYSINVLGYEETREPSIDEAVSSPQEVLSASGNITTVSGSITETRETGNLSMGRLDGSNVWVAMRSQGVIREGDEAIAQGRILRDILPQVEAVVFTSADSYGTMANPPEGIAQPRVRSNVVNLEVYENGEFVTAGDVSQNSYTRTRMTTNQVLIDRGLTKDIYVIGSIDDGSASITVKTIPLTNQVWFGVGLLLLGMSLVVVFDPRHGLIPAFRRRKDKTPSGDKKARATDD